MFTPAERDQFRSELLAAAGDDARIVAAAITGSAAAGSEDAWSDIDLAFAVGESHDISAVLADWTARMYATYGAVHHLDVHAGAWIYRVFLLSSTLQVDLAFVTAPEFRPLAPTFRLVFGSAGEPASAPPPQAADLAGYAWLYALHVRSSLARQRFWQAEHMIRGVRDHALALACLRHGLTTAHGKGFDLLPPEVLSRFQAAFPLSLTESELSRAFSAVVACLMHELRLADSDLARRLEGPVGTITIPLQPLG